MDLGLDEFIGTAEKLCSNDDYRRRPIADFLILLLREVYEYTPRRMFDLQKTQDRRAVIRYRNFLGCILFTKDFKVGVAIERRVTVYEHIPRCYPQAFCQAQEAPKSS